MSETTPKTEYVKDKTGFVYVKHAGMEDLIGRGELQECDAPEPVETVVETTTQAPAAPTRPHKRASTSAQVDAPNE